MYTISQTTTKPRKAAMMSPYFASLFLFVTSSPAADSVRDALSAKSDRMFFWLVVSSLVVLFGVVLEAPGETHELKRWWKLWRLGKTRSWFIPVSYLGLLLVCGGVVGEGIFEYLSANAETAIRAHDETVLGDTIKEAGTAKDSAEAAEAAATAAGTAAHNATDASGKAVVSANNALDRATGARKEADSYAHDIASAKQEAANAVSKLADAEQRLADSTEKEVAAEARLSAIKTPRSLIHVGDLTTALKPYKGTEYILNTFMDNESIQFTRAIGNELEAAGWIRKQPTNMNIGVPTMQVVFHEGSANELVPSCVDTGISIHVSEKDTIASLRSLPYTSLPMALRAAIALNANIGASISPPDEKNVMIGVLEPKPSDEKPVVICVGKKP